MKKYKKVLSAPVRWTLYDYALERGWIDHVPFRVFFKEKTKKYVASIYSHTEKVFIDTRRNFDNYESAYDYGSRFIKRVCG